MVGCAAQIPLPSRWAWWASRIAVQVDGLPRADGAPLELEHAERGQFGAVRAGEPAQEPLRGAEGVKHPPVRAVLAVPRPAFPRPRDPVLPQGGTTVGDLPVVVPTQPAGRVGPLAALNRAAAPPVGLIGYAHPGRTWR